MQIVGMKSRIRAAGSRYSSLQRRHDYISHNTAFHVDGVCNCAFDLTPSRGSLLAKIMKRITGPLSNNFKTKHKQASR